MSGIFLQGYHGKGKSTLLHSELKRSKLPQCGYYVQRLLDDDLNTCGFVAHPLPAHDVVLTARVSQTGLEDAFIVCHGSQVDFDPAKFVSTATKAIGAGSEKAKVVVLDEVGGIELLDDDFYHLICTVLATHEVVGIMKWDHNYNLLRRSGGFCNKILEQRRGRIHQLFQIHDIRLFTLDDTNHEAVKVRLRAFLQEIGELNGEYISTRN